MNIKHRRCAPTSRLLTGTCIAAGLLATQAIGGERKPPVHQYQFNDIVVAAAKPDEPRRTEVSIDLAAKYLDDGAAAWIGRRRCVSCHTDGAYLLARPALTPQLGAPPSSVRDFYVTSLTKLRGADRAQLLKGVRPAQIVYTAAGLAEWDRHVRRSLSPETEEALRLMFRVQLPDGSWPMPRCWPPTESSPYQKATVAAMAIATAPGWLEGLKDSKLRAACEKLKNYLRTTPPLMTTAGPSCCGPQPACRG